jgi:hypothetical protein
MFSDGMPMMPTLQRQNTEISKQVFSEKEYLGLSPNFHIHASVSDLYISTIDLPILLEEICGPILGIYKSLTDTCTVHKLNDCLHPMECIPETQFLMRIKINLGMLLHM